MSTPQYQPPGWYHGEGDPPGTKRYWDGELWVGEPQLMSSGPPRPTGAPAPPHQPLTYPESSRATSVLVIGILSLVACGILGPFAWSMGNTELEAIDSGRRDPSNRGTAQAGRILGMIATAFLALGVIFFILIVLVGLSA